MSPFSEPKKVTKWLGIPKVGEQYDYSKHGMVTAIEKVENADHKKGKFNFTRKEVVELFDEKGNKVQMPKIVDTGYYYKLTFADGMFLSISNWTFYYALQKAGIAEGVSFKCDHPLKGEYFIEAKK